MARQSLNLVSRNPRIETLVRRTCCLVGGYLLKFCIRIGVLAVLALVITIGYSSAALGDPPITSPTNPSAVPVVAPSSATVPAPLAVNSVELGATKKKIVAYGKLIRGYQDKLGLRHSRMSTSGLRTRSLAYAKWTLTHRQSLSRRLHAQYRRWMVKQSRMYTAELHRWSQELGMSWHDRQLLGEMSIEARYNELRKAAQEYEKRWDASFLLNAFTCIHRYEGAWNDNTGNGYYGGLQMDLPFQSRYGGAFLRRWGTADNWPTWAQLQAAVRAYREGRGFGPWPNTARDCGLL